MRSPLRAFGALLLVAVASLLVAGATAGAETPRTATSFGWPVSASPLGDVVFAEMRQNTIDVRSATPGGGLGPGHTLGHNANFVPDIVSGPHGEVSASWQDVGTHWGMATAFRPPGKAFGRRVTLTTAEPVDGSVDTGFDAAGNATVVWATDTGGIHIRSRSRAGRWGPSRRLRATGASAPRIAVTASGAATVVWSQPGPHRGASQVRLATRPAGGTFGAPHELTSSKRDPSEPLVASNDRGDTVVAWVETDETAALGFSVHGAFRQGMAGSFGPATLLSRPSEASTTPSASVAPDGRMTLAWRDSLRHKVEARIRTAAGVLLPVQVLSGHELEDSTVAALATGSGLVAWYDGSGRIGGAHGQPMRLRTARAAPDGTFAPPHTWWTTRHAEAEDPFVFATTSGLLLVTPTGRILRG